MLPPAGHQGGVPPPSQSLHGKMAEQRTVMARIMARHLVCMHRPCTAHAPLIRAAIPSVSRQGTGLPPTWHRIRHVAVDRLRVTLARAAKLDYFHASRVLYAAGAGQQGGVLGCCAPSRSKVKRPVAQLHVRQAGHAVDATLHSTPPGSAGVTGPPLPDLPWCSRWQCLQQVRRAEHRPHQAEFGQVQHTPAIRWHQILP